jgi:hypothetical protein
MRLIFAVLGILLTGVAQAVPYRIELNGTLDWLIPPPPGVAFPFVVGQSLTGWMEFESDPADFREVTWDIQIGDVHFLTAGYIGFRLTNEPGVDHVELSTSVQPVTGYPGSYIGDMNVTLLGPAGAIGTAPRIEDFWAITHGYFAYSGTYDFPKFSGDKRYNLRGSFTTTSVPEPSTMALSAFVLALVGVMVYRRRRMHGFTDA